MNVFYFCAQIFVLRVCRMKGKGRLCPLATMHNVFRQSAFLLAMLCVCLTSATAQEAPDSVADTGKRFRPQQLIIPSALIATGAFGVNNGWFCSVKEHLRDDFQDLRGDCRFRADDYLQYLPVTANLGLEFVGVKPKHPFRERFAATATAYVAMGLIVNVTKYAVKEKRPDSGTRNSFPSGHTATAFMGAELVREEYGNTYGTCAYTLATSIAILRLYNDRHWLNDIIAGAGTGILAARIGYWLLPWERKWLGLEKSSMTMAILPCYDYTDKSFSIAMTTCW